MTVTRSSLFRGFRNILDIKLFKCPYCFAHWVSFVLWASYVALYPQILNPLDFIINVFATVALSVVPMIAIEFLNNLVDNNARFSRISS